MPRGTAAATVLTMLKAELGHVLDAGVAEATDTQLKYLLDNKIKWLATEYEWPFLELRSGVALTPGVRYYDLPTDIVFEKVVRTHVKWNELWKEVVYGIGAEELNAWDSDVDDRQTPVEAWNFYGADEFEVWPIPSVAQVFRFVGQKTLNSIVAGQACELDDIMVVLFVAADVLAKYEEKHAGLKLQQAQQRLARLLSQYSRRDPVWNLNPAHAYMERKLVGVSSGSGGELNTMTGTHEIANGVDIDTVSYPTQLSPPTSVVLTVESPAGGSNLFATLMSGTVSDSGFTFTLSSPTDQTGYKLHYRASF